MSKSYVLVLQSWSLMTYLKELAECNEVIDVN
jgi:hypothetical protein